MYGVREFVEGQTSGQLIGEFVDGQITVLRISEFVDGQTHHIMYKDSDVTG